MFLEKSNKSKIYPQKSRLDQLLWLIENYLPQKNRQASRKELRLITLESLIINQIQRLASVRSKSLTSKQTNSNVSFTFGSWALPYLKLMKQIGLAK